MDWVRYWDDAPTVYAGERHKRVHYEDVARGIAALVERADARVLDYGCGEALSAHLVRARCGHLLLCDAAPGVRERLAERFAGAGGIAVVAPGDLAQLPEASVDLVVANSVVQYMDEAALARAVRDFRRILAPEGRIVFADIVPPGGGAAADAAALLAYGARNGFLGAAMAGLARTALSDYRRLRSTLGLATFTEAGFVDTLARHGLAARRIWPNIGHNQRRMAFEARPAAAQDTAPSRNAQ